MAILKIQGLTKIYKQEHFLSGFKCKRRAAVQDVCLELEEGKTLALVGESGCGKSTLAKLVLKLIAADAGRVFFAGKEITELKEAQFRFLRKDMQIVFQDPYASLSPRLNVERIISEPLQAFADTSVVIRKRCEELLENVGLDRAHLGRFPHQLSGGQRQRVGIARALATFPKLVVLDEPVSSLDLSTQAQIVNLLVDLQRKYKLSYLFIAHDLGLVKYISDDVAVMYGGHIVEQAPARELYANPLHPYTRMLLKSRPDFKARIADPLSAEQEQRGDRAEHISGCVFQDRCVFADAKCGREKPLWRQISPGHALRCFKYDTE